MDDGIQKRFRARLLQDVVKAIQEAEPLVKAELAGAILGAQRAAIGVLASAVNTATPASPMTTTTAAAARTIEGVEARAIAAERERDEAARKHAKISEWITLDCRTQYERAEAAEARAIAAERERDEALHWIDQWINSPDDANPARSINNRSRLLDRGRALINKPDRAHAAARAALAGGEKHEASPTLSGGNNEPA